jgi:hypothetical protein
MKRRVSSSLRHVGLAAMLAAGLIAAPSALGAAPPTDLASNPASPGGTGNWTFTWTDGVPELAGPVTYEGGLVANILDLPVNAPLVSGVEIDPPEGNFWFKVRSVEPGAVESAYAILPITVDETGPTASLSLSGPSGGVGGWFRSPLNVVVSACTDAVAGIAPAQCANREWTTPGFFAAGAASVQLTDLVGNTSNLPIPPAFGYDTVPPATSVGGGTSPVSPGALVASEPTFEWSPGLDVLSGVDRYRLVFATRDDFDTDGPSGGQVIANRNDTGPGGNYTATRDESLRPSPLPVNVELKWWVRSIDKAGNVRNSSAFDLKIDPTVPPAPSITGGPNAPTQETGPTFTWQGTEDNFSWELTTAGSQQPIRQGGGAATQTTLAALPDGDYVFRLTQITEAGQSSAEATRSFKVDTTAPTAPTITARPTFPSIGVSPTFSWTTEPGAFSRWSVVNAAGAVVGPIDTPVTSAELPALAEGPYTFQVVQIDPAGNVSAATTEGFTVIAPLVPAPGDDAQATFLASLPKQNALRLKPKAGTTLPTLRPVLRWKKGPRGTKLYNLQIFQVTKRKNNAKPKVTKVLSRFPRSLQFRTPSKGLKAGTCYVWRVWPYTGTAFTTRPVGVSNFCVASKTVLRKKALAALAAKKAAQRRAAIARRR